MSSPTGGRTPRGSQRFVLDRLQIVGEGHLLPGQTFDRKQLDDLVLMPNGKLAALGYHLEQDRTSGQLRPDVVGRQIELDTPITSHMAQIHLPIQESQPGIRVHPRMARAGKGGNVGKATRGGTLPQVRRLSGTFFVVVLEKRLCDLAYPPLACWVDEAVSTPVRRFYGTAQRKHSCRGDAADRQQG